MPHINPPWSKQSTVTGWQKRDIRRRSLFPTFKPKYPTWDFFRRRFPTTQLYRETLEPAQVYSGGSRPEYMDLLREHLSKLPSEKTLQIRWRLNSDKPAFTPPFLQMYLTRKYGPVVAMYQQAVNSCLVVFKEAESAYVLSRDTHKGHPHGRLYTRWWNPLPQDDSYCGVLKHIEVAAQTKARYNELMDREDRSCLTSEQHSYTRALAVRNKSCGPSMQPALSHGRDMEGLFKVTKPQERKAKPPGEKGHRIRAAADHTQFKAMMAELPLTLVKFHAQWCGPCKALEPQVEELSREHRDVTFISVDVDDNSDTADFCNIAVLPTFQFYIHGKMVDEVRGSAMEALKDKIRIMKQLLAVQAS